MAKDLTVSQHERQNILNNRYVLEAAQSHLALGGVSYQGQTVFTKQQLMALYDISDTTVERYLSSHGDELKSNGHEVLSGKNSRNSNS